jgi:hypothetical protein
MNNERSIVKKNPKETINQYLAWACFCVFAILSFVSILIVLVTSLMKSNGSGFAYANSTYHESTAKTDFFSFCFAYAGSVLCFITSLSATVFFGRLSIKKNKTTCRIIPATTTAAGTLWGDTPSNAPNDAMGALGGKAHKLVRLLTSIQHKGPSHPNFDSSIGRCIRILQTNPNLWDADRTTIDRVKKVTSDSQTGVWLQSILSATPDWLERDEDEDEGAEDEVFGAQTSAMQVKQANEEQNVANQSVQSSDKRRKSSFQGMVHKIIIGKRMSPFQYLKEDEDLVHMMDSIFGWQFDVFLLDKHVANQSLVFLSMEAVRRLRLPLDILPQSQAFNSFMKDIQSGYVDNPYHNRLHAADVVQTCGHFLACDVMKIAVKPLDRLCLLVAAAIHDYAHPGVNNGFLVTTHSSIAIRHNDDSPLERFHCAEAFRVMGQKGNVFLSEWSKLDQNRFRHAVIQLVLCTDLGLGLGLINQFNVVKDEIRASCSKNKQPMVQAADFSIPTGSSKTDDAPALRRSAAKRTSSFGYPKLEYRLLVLKVALRCADISHPTKQYHIHQRWTECINQEFFAQGKKEKELQLPVSPLCEEDGFNLAKSQQGFISFLVKPTFVPFAEFAEGSEWIAQLDENFQRWKQLEEDNKKLKEVPVEGYPEVKADEEKNLV